MNAQAERKLLHYGVHPAVIAAHVANVTYNANPARLTRSRRVNKTLRRVVWLLLVLAVFVAARLA